MVLAATRATGRGRQPAEVEAQRDLREELTAVLAESRDYAERVMEIGLELAGGSPSRQQVMNLGGQLVYRSSRRLTQLGSVVL